MIINGKSIRPQLAEDFLSGDIDLRPSKINTPLNNVRPQLAQDIAESTTGYQLRVRHYKPR